MIARYALPVALVASLALSLALWRAEATKARLSVQNAAQSATITALEDQRAQARLAADVARAEAERQAIKAREYDALRESLLKGKDDEPLPQWFRDYLQRLLAGGLPSP